MDRALDGTGLHMFLRMVVVPTHAIIEGPIVHPNVSRTAENHHRHCKC